MQFQNSENIYLITAKHLTLSVEPFMLNLNEIINVYNDEKFLEVFRSQTIPDSRPYGENIFLITTAIN